MKNILCLDMDCFFVSVERVLNPGLQKKPVIVGGKPNSRGVVSACSYETREFGVHSGMALTIAYQKCPDAIFLMPNFKAYGYYSKLIAKILKKYIPIVEQASVDEFYLDLTGCEGIYGDIFNFTWRLKRYLETNLKLPMTIGMGTNKHIAKIASNLAKSQGLLKVLPGEEALFLGPLPIDFIQGVGKQTKKTLYQSGIRTIGKLASIPIRDITKLLGKFGVHLLLKAQGKGSQEFELGRQRKSLGAERTFTEDTTDLEYIKSKLSHIVEKVCFQLRKEGFKTSCVTFKIRYSDFKTETKRVTISPTDYNQVIFKTAWGLFEKLYQRRVRIRLIGISLSKLQKEALTSLFFDSYKLDNLYQAIDKIKIKHGPMKIHWST
ncbi:DNA polymerase IV [Candidatus Margulisiibacteriota bacterium]